ncbi:hypothetical protein COB57_03525 [Candidatus Peregrinibacteria bacterium]|nr:MAG: hypothetical protein COB57_03525 [Candidatus Peregrinibacteria bacterium]
MKNVSVIFTKEKKAPFALLSSEQNGLLQQQLNHSSVEMKKGFVEVLKQGESPMICVKIGEKAGKDGLQKIGGSVIKTVFGLGKKDGDFSVCIQMDTSVPSEDVFFIEKGLLLAKDAYRTLHEKQKHGTVVIEGVVSENVESIVAAMELTRDLISLPSNIMTPDVFEARAEEVAKNDKNISYSILRKKDLEKENMNMHIAVCAASPNEPRVTILDYCPKGAEKDEPIVLVGKGLMYDSGGLYAKPAPFMNEMYADMGGAATVIGIMSGLSALGIKKRVVGLCGVAENLIDGESYRNGDILTSRKGLTVEVAHTDAEGRLVLADVLSYAADTYKPSLLLDYATLTGACLMAVGENYTAVFSDSEELIAEFSAIGKEVNDKLWALPFDDDIKENVKSKVADLTNTATTLGRMLGASTAAAFISNFVPDTKKWMHFDIAGSAMRTVLRKDYDYQKLTGTGSMVHTTLVYLQKQS